MINIDTLNLNHSLPAFQKMEQTVLESSEGRKFLVRQVAGNDTAVLADFLSRLSQPTRHLRFFIAPAQMPEEMAWREARRVTEDSTWHRLALVATVEKQGAIALAELIRNDRNPWVAELAIVVRDDYQREGVGSLLVTHLVQMARRSGINLIQAEFLAENQGVRRMVRRLGLPYNFEIHYGEAFLSIPLN
jgi:acetyltransferase